MKRKIILGGLAILILGMSVALYVTVNNPRTSPAPIQLSLQESVKNTTNQPFLNGSSVGNGNEVSEKKTRPSITEPPPQVLRTSTGVSSIPSQTMSAARGTDNKFNGTWVLDKTRAEGLVPGMNQVMIVTQAGNVMNVKTILNTNDKGEWTATDAYVLNGRETEFASQSSRGGTERGKRITKLTDNGNGIEINEQGTVEEQGASISVGTTRRWTIADDKSLIIEMNIKGIGFTHHNKRVFIRQ